MRQACRIIASGTLVILVLLLQGCAARWWWESKSGQEGMAQGELIKEPQIKVIAPDDERLADSRTHHSELSARNATGLIEGKLGDVLFDFDQDSITTDAIRSVESNAKELRQEKVTHLILEGRSDEFGSSAYNLVLGERRARSVRSYLRELGLSIEVTTTSYGKDRPLCIEHSGDCGQRNRSVHFVVE